LQRSDSAHGGARSHCASERERDQVGHAN
jgi:hypothetical protein